MNLAFVTEAKSDGRIKRGGQSQTDHDHNTK